MPDLRDLPDLPRIPPKDHKAVFIAALIAICYIVYITAFMVIGKDPADGVLLSGVIGSIAFVGGYRIKSFGEYYGKKGRRYRE